LIFITEKESVYCAVRAENLDVIQLNHSLKEAVLWLRGLVSGLSLRRVGYNSTGIYVIPVVDNVGLGQVSPVSILPPMLHSHLHVSLTRRTEERSLDKGKVLPLQA
jgi:hypothetical protein